MRESIGIVGAGLIGRAWAIVFARAGHQVRLTDVDMAALARSHTLIGERLKDLNDFGLITESPAQVLARITCTDSLAAAVEGAALVQENVARRCKPSARFSPASTRCARPTA